MEIATNVCKLSTFEDMVFYKAVCGCNADNHDRTLMIEIEEDGTISCSVSAEMKYYDWKYSNSNIFLKTWSRIKGAFKILFTGYIAFDGEFMFNGEKATVDYANAILEAVEHVKQRKVSTVPETTGHD